MRFTFVTVLSVALLSASHAQEQGKSFGAIAFNPATNTLFAVTDEPSFKDAETEAARGCVMASSVPASCQVPLVFWDGCGALARADKQIYGTGWGPTQSEAKKWAFKVCTDFGGKKCRLGVVICTPGGEGFIPPA